MIWHTDVVTESQMARQMTAIREVGGTIVHYLHRGTDIEVVWTTPPESG